MTSATLTPGSLAHGARFSFEAAFSMPLAFTSAAMLLLSPMAALALSAFLLINLPSRTPRTARLILGLVVAAAMALLAGNRPVDSDASNDIDGYYEAYLSIAGGESAFDTQFGAGLETGLPLLMSLFSALLPPLSMNGLMFCFSLAASLLMLCWVEMGASKRTQRQNLALLGICLIMLNLYFATQLSRQFLSLLVLLYAFTASTRLRQIVWVLIAASFHLTALPFFGACLLARRGRAGWLVIAVVVLVFRTYFAAVLTTLDVLPDALIQKLLYYADDLNPDGASDLASLRMVGLLAAISLVVLASTRFRPADAAKPWLGVPWLTALVYVMLLPIPLASLRATLMMHSVAPGLIAFKMLELGSRRLLTTVLNGLLGYKILSLAMQAPNLQSGFGMLSGFFL